MAGPREWFVVADAQALPVKSAAYDAVVAALVPNFLPEPQRAVSDMARATHPSGLVVAYVWDYAGEMQFVRAFWSAARALDPGVNVFDAELTGQQVLVCKPAPLAGLFHAAGLRAVEVRAIDVSTHFCDFDDFWLPHGFCQLSPLNLSRSFNLSHFVACKIWRRRGVSLLRGRAHRLPRREPFRCLLRPMDIFFDRLQTAIN
jgi:SAM-dependent methyltransferase